MFQEFEIGLLTVPAFRVDETSFSVVQQRVCKAFDGSVR